jgi:hypothetical protein
MRHAEKQLHEVAQNYPWYVFTVEEIANLCHVSRDMVSKVKAAPDSPFCLNKCRPEWFLEWMRKHPDFQLTKAHPHREHANQGQSQSRVSRKGFRAKRRAPKLP